MGAWSFCSLTGFKNTTLQHLRFQLRLSYQLQAIIYSTSFLQVIIWSNDLNLHCCNKLVMMECNCGNKLLSVDYKRRRSLKHYENVEVGKGKLWYWNLTKPIQHNREQNLDKTNATTLLTEQTTSSAIDSSLTLIQPSKNVCLHRALIQSQCSVNWESPKMHSKFLW